MIKNKIAFVLSNEIFFRHYISTGALESVAKDHELTLLADHKLRPLIESQKVKHRTVYYQYPLKLEKQVRLINELSMFANQHLSKDFPFRIKRKWNSSPHQRDGTRNTNPKFLRLKVFVKKKIYSALASEKVINLLRERLKKAFISESPLRQLIYEGSYDVVIAASNAAGAVETDVASITDASKSSPKTVLLVDNWDNISSKYIMPFHPDLLAVWGEQTRFQAITMQNVKPNKVVALGTPRFASYFKSSTDSREENSGY